MANPMALELISGSLPQSCDLAGTRSLASKKSITHADATQDTFGGYLASLRRGAGPGAVGDSRSLNFISCSMYSCLCMVCFPSDELWRHGLNLEGIDIQNSETFLFLSESP
jgi:hypothetical protein